MTTADISMSGLSETEHSRQLRRALIASTVGTTIEWYDFLLYGQVTGLVFGKLFFPQSDPLVGVLQAFAVFFVGFLGRPLGRAIFGHWGDRIGRKATLIATLLVTGLATMAVGLVPTYESVGIWVAVLLVVIRLIQGIGVGGEWGGSVLLAMEWARTNKNRGLLAAWPQFGGPAGLFWPIWRCCSSAGGPVTSSWFGDGGFRSFSALSWLGSVCGSGSASPRPRSSRRCSTKNASNACRSWKCSSVSQSRSR